MRTTLEECVNQPTERDGDRWVELRRPEDASAGAGSLTRRELEIARLIADHRTNREIAATLLLSTKTVETHVRIIFHELDVSSRRQVAPVIVPA